MKNTFFLEYLDIDINFIKNLDVIYSMGPYSFNRYLISILFLWVCFFIIYRKRIINFIESLFKKNVLYKHLIYITPLACLGFIVAYLFASQYNDNYEYFYPPVYSVTIYNPFFISFLYVTSIIIFYFFSFQILKSKNLSFISSFLWTMSSMHLMNLLSSPLRDYIKAPLFIFNFIFIFLILNQKEKNFIFLTCISVLFYSISIIFKTDLYLLLPIYIFAIFLNNNSTISIRFFASLIFFVISYIHIHLTYVPSRGFHRLGTSMSHEMFPTLKNLSSIGTWYDLTFIVQTCIANKCNMTYGFFYYIFSHIDEIILRAFFTFKTIIVLPFAHGILPPINTYLSNIFYYKLFFFKYIIFFENFYLIFLIIFYSIFIIINKNLYHIYYTLFLALMIFVYSLEFFGKHYFFLEIFSIIIFVFIMNKIIKSLLFSHHLIFTKK